MAELNPARARFDPTFNWGHILTVLGLVGLGVTTWFTAQMQIQALEAKFGYLAEKIDNRLTGAEKKLERLTDVIITQAKQDERVTGMERRLDRVERRDGMIGRP